MSSLNLLQDTEGTDMTDERDRLAALRDKAAALPSSPGVYIMQNEAGRVIYVGKSRSLRDRVSQYFHGTHDPKTGRMAASVRDFRFVVCDTEMEALALENSLIKQYTPKYNIKLKDAKSYPYLRIDMREEWPKIRMTRKRLPDGALYFGPYSSTATVYQALSQIGRSLKIPTCKRRFPEEFGRNRPCINYQIGRCPGVCTGRVPNGTYREAIERAADFLRGGTRDAVLRLTERMNEASEAMEYEKAAAYRDAIDSLRKLGEHQKAVGSPDLECDVVGLHLDTAGDGVRVGDCVTIFFVRSGYIADTEHALFGGDEIVFLPDGDDGDSSLTPFLLSLYQGREYIPPEILLSFDLPEHDRVALSGWLTDRAGRRVEVRTPKRGDLRRLCAMAVTDAEEHAAGVARRDRDREKTLGNLASLLKLEVYPERIEAYDISNLGNEAITCGMVVALNGRLKKSEYRTFTIRTTGAQDDYAAMAEAIERRLAHIGRENDSMAAWPDLILLDGGIGHVGVIRRLLDESGYDIPVFGMVKDEHHKTRTLVDGSGELSLVRHPDVFRLIYGIQEEVHRYSVSRMSGAKRKTLRISSLEKIRGIGPAKADALLSAFPSFAALKAADESALAAVRGISAADARAIRRAFSEGEKENKNKTTTDKTS